MWFNCVAQLLDGFFGVICILWSKMRFLSFALWTHEAFTNFITTYISPYSYTHNNNPTFVCVRYSVLISLTSFNFFFKLACIVPVDLLIKNGKVVFNARKNCLKIIEMQSQYNKRNVTHKLNAFLVWLFDCIGAISQGYIGHNYFIVIIKCDLLLLLVYP